jgi:hypothetical protein
MGWLMAATVATNDQGQIPLIERPQGLLGQRELLPLLHACLLSLPRPVGHRAHDPDTRSGPEVTSLSLWTENDPLPRAVALFA